MIDFDGKIPIVKWVTISAAYSVLSEVVSSIRKGGQRVQKDQDQCTKYIKERDQKYTGTLWDTLKTLNSERASGEKGFTALEKQGIKGVN